MSKKRMSIIEILAENRRRIADNDSFYDPVTGEGSNAVDRREVTIDDSPVKKLYLPVQMLEVGFIQCICDIGFARFAEHYMHTSLTERVKEELWTEFCRIRIEYDFEFWGVMCAVIEDKITGRDIPFRLNRAQRIYLKELETLRLAGKPIDIILLKARQWGGSTLTQLYMLWIQLVHRKNWHSVICGQVESQSNTVAGMLSKVIKNYPSWAYDGPLLDTSPFERSQKTRIINLTGSRYSIGSAEKPDSIRSQNIKLAHLTEVGLWQATAGKKPEDLVQSIFGSVYTSEYTMKVLESTAKGVGNYFHRTWEDAVKGENNFHPVFIPWFAIDMYSEKLDKYEIQDFASSLDDYEYFLFELGATLQAIKWYRIKSKELNDRWRMCSEFPSTPSEAFQSTGRRVFAVKYVENLRRTCTKPSFYGEFVGKTEKGKDAFKNLRFIEMQPEADYYNILKVWALPDYSVRYHDRYMVSVDVGGSSNKSDFSAIRVIDRLPMLEEGGLPEIVAEWHGHIDHDLLIWKAAQIAEAYCHALLIIESNTLETEGTEGDNFDYILDEIVDSYDNLYSRTPPEKIKQGAPVKYGWHTNPKTKPTIINSLKSAARDMLYIERSSGVTFEMDVFELKEDGKQTGAAEGCHDDLLMATAILIYVCYKWDLPRIFKDTKAGSNKTRIISEASI